MGNIEKKITKRILGQLISHCEHEYASIDELLTANTAWDEEAIKLTGKREAYREVLSMLRVFNFLRTVGK